MTVQRARDRAGRGSEGYPASGPSVLVWLAGFAVWVVLAVAFYAAEVFSAAAAVALVLVGALVSAGTTVLLHRRRLQQADETTAAPDGGTGERT